MFTCPKSQQTRYQIKDGLTDVGSQRVRVAYVAAALFLRPNCMDISMTYGPRCCTNRI